MCTSSQIITCDVKVPLYSDWLIWGLPYLNVLLFLVYGPEIDVINHMKKSKVYMANKINCDTKKNYSKYVFITNLQLCSKPFNMEHFNE